MEKILHMCCEYDASSEGGLDRIRSPVVNKSGRIITEEDYTSIFENIDLQADRNSQNQDES
jgi:hypothetical protein